MSNHLVLGTSPDDYDEPEEPTGPVTEHVWYEHNEANPCPYEGGMGCKFCNGGLGLCTVCGLAEGELTTHCPGRPATEEEADRIYNLGNLDFRFGAWVDEGSPHSPAIPRRAKQRPQIAGVDW